MFSWLCGGGRIFGSGAGMPGGGGGMRGGPAVITVADLVHGVGPARGGDVLASWAQSLSSQPARRDRGWDAIVIGEYERAFYGNQYASMAPLFERYGIDTWYVRLADHSNR